jgi:hypothetical protein
VNSVWNVKQRGVEIERLTGPVVTLMLDCLSYCTAMTLIFIASLISINLIIVPYNSFSAIDVNYIAASVQVPLSLLTGVFNRYDVFNAKCDILR